MVNVATFGIIKKNNMKEKQKQILSKMMQEDEKSGFKKADTIEAGL